ncbi:MAG: Icc-related predicted phosphoesterase [Pirellulaceae bacterium]|jgi:Icc-related predicted phosphoesterase
MKLVIISDTHAQHDELRVMRGDVLIHCGDFCDGFRIDENDLANVDRWFGTLDFELILVVGGNHDFVAQKRRSEGTSVFSNAVYLEDESYQFGGVNFYGSPWVPELDKWAYYLPDADLRDAWARIPSDTDVLITHTPPFGILDRTRSGNQVGCPFLRSAVAELNLRVHCFGHVHSRYGQHDESSVKFINASSVDSNYSIRNIPMVVEI